MFKRVLSVIMAVLILCSLMPSVSASDDEAVLTSIGHISTDKISLSGDARYVTLTVPFQYADAGVDLTNGLVIAYDETAYKSVVATPELPGTAGVGVETYTAVTVTYQGINEDDTAPKSQSVYYVRVEREQAESPTFSGIISKTVARGDTLTLDSSVFENYYKQNDGNDLDYIRVSGSNLVYGDLIYSGGDVFDSDVYFTGTLTFAALMVGTVSYDITAYQQGSSEPVGAAVLTISVYAPPTLGSYSGNTYVGATQSYSDMGLANCINKEGSAPTALELTPVDNNFGTWYLGTDALSAGSPHTILFSQLSSLTFKGTAVGTASFTWRVLNAAGYSEYASGSISVLVTNLVLSAYSSSTQLEKGSTWTVSPAHFSYSPQTVPLTYIKIVSVPTSTDGYLCLTTALLKSTEYGYSAINANVALVAGAVIPYNYVQYLRLVTKNTSAANAVSFAWTATVDSVATSATWVVTAASYSVPFKTGGTVSYEADMNIPLILSASDFSKAYYTQTGYTLSYVTFTLPNTTYGSLYYNYDIATKKGTAVSSTAKYYTGSNPNLSYITFVPAADYVGTATITYKAYRSSGESVEGKLLITVDNSNGGTFTYTIDKNDSKQLDAADLAKSFLAATGETLSYVKFTLPSSTYGKLYYDYVSSSNYESLVSASTKYYAYTSPYLSYVSFVPHTDFTGQAVINFTGYTEDGESYSGKVIIFVVDSPAGIVSYTSKVNGTVALSGEDFADEFISVTGSVLSYVQFTLPVNTIGTLYSDYSAESGTGTKIGSATKYYNGSTPDISDITFVPVKDYVGKAEIKYTVYTAAGVSYVGKLKIQVGEAGSGSVLYSTKYNTAVTLQSADFASKFYSNTGGSTLKYLYFTLPSTSYGKLYYNYSSSSGVGTAVSSSTPYYTATAPNISSITFVPKSGYSGSFTVSFIGYASDGIGYVGKLTITVGSQAGTVNYEVTYPDTVIFRASDFKEALEDAEGEALDYVKFTLPDASKGTLYYKYSSSSSSSSKLSASTRYYAASSPSLSDITFVPKLGYSGNLTINYTAYDTDGDSYESSVIISVNGSNGGVVEYETEMNKPVNFSSTDFNSAFADETGSNLSYIKFTLPSAGQGTLYYEFTSSGSSISKVSASTKYYRSSSPYISSITFVPNTNFSGIVTIPYTGYTSGGAAYSGTLSITVKDPNTHPFADVGKSYAWADSAIAYLYNNSVVTGTGSETYSPEAKMIRGDFMLMVCRAFEFDKATGMNFKDVSENSYYYDAVMTAKALGIAQGGDGMFYPAKGISRQDAAVIIYRTLTLVGVDLKSGSYSDISAYSDAKNISAYAVNAMATLVRNGILVGSGGALNPQGIVSRAEMAVILYRALQL